MKLYEKIIALPDPEVSWSNYKPRLASPALLQSSSGTAVFTHCCPVAAPTLPDHRKQDNHPGPTVTPTPALPIGWIS